jgi:hypothetical protein
MEPPLRSVEVSCAFGPYHDLSFHIIACDTVKGCSRVCCWVRCALPTLSMRTRCARLSDVSRYDRRPVYVMVDGKHLDKLVDILVQW